MEEVAEAVEAPELTLYERMQLVPFYHPFMNKQPDNFDFEKDGDKAEELSLALFRLMNEVKTVGISAKQAGLNWRVLTVGKEQDHITMFNPLIVAASENTVAMEERCVTLKDFQLTLQRPEWVVVTYQDFTGEFHTAKFDGVAARVIQHEYDHMLGFTFTNRASNMKLKHELKKWRNTQKKNARRVVKP